ncbi:MAG: hypothetical protein ABIE68_01125 [bacterium]
MKKIFLTLFVIIVCGLGIYIYLDSYNPPVEISAQLDELEIKKPVLVYMNAVEGADKNDVKPGVYIKSIDGRVSARFNTFAYANMEFITPTEMLIYGNMNDNEKAGLYKISVSGIEETDVADNYVFEKPSISPTKEFIRSGEDENLCIATYDEKEKLVGSCQKVVDKIPGEWNWEDDYYVDSNWKTGVDEYVIRIRSKKESYFESSPNSGQLPLQLQKEVARYVYNAKSQTLVEDDLDNPISLKGSNEFMQENDWQKINKFRENYKITGNYKEKAVIIKDLNTEQVAKLFDAPYMKDIPIFDMKYFGGYL